MRAIFPAYAYDIMDTTPMKDRFKDLYEELDACQTRWKDSWPEANACLSKRIDLWREISTQITKTEKKALQTEINAWTDRYFALLNEHSACEKQIREICACQVRSIDLHHEHSVCEERIREICDYIHDETVRIEAERGNQDAHCKKQAQDECERAIEDIRLCVREELDVNERTAETWTCPTCGRHEITGRFCPNCGYNRSRQPLTTAEKKIFPPKTWNCSCGQTDITSIFCTVCGTKRPED